MCNYYLRLAKAEATKNEIAKTCNSSSVWVQQTQKKLDKSSNAIQSGKQYVKALNEIDEQVSEFFLM